MAQGLVVEQRGLVRWITIDRPERRNALDEDTTRALRDALLACEGDDSARVVVLAGAGGAFSTGGDLRATQDSPEPADAAKLQAYNRRPPVFSSTPA